MADLDGKTDTHLQLLRFAQQFIRIDFVPFWHPGPYIFST